MVDWRVQGLFINDAFIKEEITIENFDVRSFGTRWDYYRQVMADDNLVAAGSIG